MKVKDSRFQGSIFYIQLSLDYHLFIFYINLYLDYRVLFHQTSSLKNLVELAQL